MATRPLFDVGVLRDTLLPNLGFHTALAVPVYLIGRGTDTFEAKDSLWPSGMVANAWWSALGRPVLLDGVPVDTVWKSISYPGKLILTGVTLWGGRLFYRILSRRLKRGTDDARYKPLHKDPKAWNSAIWKTFLPEAIVQAFITLPFTAPFKLTPVLKCPDDARGVLAAVAVGLFSAGFALEVLADFQLDNHKQRGDEGILTDGVWSIVRHPKCVPVSLPDLLLPQVPSPKPAAAIQVQ
jgi:steroid 5-alpha reductase family enzyme